MSFLKHIDKKKEAFAFLVSENLRNSKSARTAKVASTRCVGCFVHFALRYSQDLH